MKKSLETLKFFWCIQNLLDVTEILKNGMQHVSYFVLVRAMSGSEVYFMLLAPNENWKKNR